MTRRNEKSGDTLQSLNDTMESGDNTHNPPRAPSTDDDQPVNAVPFTAAIVPQTTGDSGYVSKDEGLIGWYESDVEEEHKDVFGRAHQPVNASAQNAETEIESHNDNEALIAGVKPVSQQEKEKWNSQPGYKEKGGSACLGGQFRVDGELVPTSRQPVRGFCQVVYNAASASSTADGGKLVNTTSNTQPLNTPISIPASAPLTSTLGQPLITASALGSAERRKGIKPLIALIRDTGAKILAPNHRRRLNRQLFNHAFGRHQTAKPCQAVYNYKPLRNHDSPCGEGYDEGYTPDPDPTPDELEMANIEPSLQRSRQGTRGGGGDSGQPVDLQGASNSGQPVNSRRRRQLVRTESGGGGGGGDEEDDEVLKKAVAMSGQTFGEPVYDFQEGGQPFSSLPASGSHDCDMDMNRMTIDDRLAEVDDKELEMAIELSLQSVTGQPVGGQPVDEGNESFGEEFTVEEEEALEAQEMKWMMDRSRRETALIGRGGGVGQTVNVSYISLIDKKAEEREDEQLRMAMVLSMEDLGNHPISDDDELQKAIELSMQAHSSPSPSHQPVDTQMPDVIDYTNPSRAMFLGPPATVPTREPSSSRKRTISFTSPTPSDFGSPPKRHKILDYVYEMYEKDVRPSIRAHWRLISELKTSHPHLNQLHKIRADGKKEEYKPVAMVCNERGCMYNPKGKGREGEREACEFHCVARRVLRLRCGDDK